jgi:hypothetical protein
VGRGSDVEELHRPEAEAWARAELRREGFRSLLWDTGERRKLDTGRMAIVWGIAR